MEESSVHVGKVLLGWQPWRCGLPSQEDEDMGLGLGPRPLLSDSGLLGSGEEAGPHQGRGPGVQGEDSWGHSASLSPEGERSELAAGEQQAGGLGTWQSRQPSASSPGTLPGLLPAAGQHVQSPLQAVSSHMQGTGLPGFQPRGSQAQDR